MDMESITITLTANQAYALCDAANCLTHAAEGLPMDVWMPKHGPDQDAANAYVQGQADFAQEVAQLLRHELDGVHKRDPELQEFLHRVKMMRKHRA